MQQQQQPTNHRNTETTNCNAVEGQVAMHVLKGFSPQNQNKLNEMKKKTNEHE